MGLPVGQADAFGEGREGDRTPAGMQNGAARAANFAGGLAQPGGDAHEYHDIREILGDDIPVRAQGRFHIPKVVFDPKDPWAVEFRIALQKFQPAGYFYEVGFGSGANIVYALAHRPEIIVAYGSDVMPDVSEVGAKNVRGMKGIGAHRFEHVGGAVDLLWGIGPWLGDQKLDCIIGCIPQVGRAKGAVTHLDDDDAHYFTKAPLPGFESFDKWGLTLNVHALMQAREHLKLGGRLMLNLAGRVPEHVLLEMFRATGYTPEIVHKSIIPQHTGTCLLYFREKEKEHGIEFQFFDTPCLTQQPLSAVNAQKVLDKPASVYHSLYAISGTLQA